MSFRIAFFGSSLTRKWRKLSAFFLAFFGTWLKNIAVAWETKCILFPKLFESKTRTAAVLQGSPHRRSPGRRCPEPLKLREQSCRLCSVSWCWCLPSAIWREVLKGTKQREVSQAEQFFWIFWGIDAETKYLYKATRVGPGPLSYSWVKLTQAYI